MIHIDVSKTQTRPDGLLYDPISGCLLAPPSRIERDPGQPRKTFPPEELEELRGSIDGWRERSKGPCGTGILDPLKCRWEPGAFINGEAKETAKLILWDGERRWRTTKDDYEWLPIVLDDLKEKDARDAALHTSIHKKLISRIEEAHAFAEKMAEEGWGVPRLSRHYRTSPGYINNRLQLLEIPLDLQMIVDEKPKKMSHALLLRSHRDKILKDDWPSFVEDVKSGISVADLRGEIESYLAELKSIKDTAKAPDKQTQQRSAEHARNGGGNVSRGRIVQTTTRQEATAVVEGTAAEIERHLRTLEAWKAHVPAKQFTRAVGPLRAQLDRLCDDE